MDPQTRLFAAIAQIRSMHGPRRDKISAENSRPDPRPVGRPAATTPLVGACALGWGAMGARARRSGTGRPGGQAGDPTSRFTRGGPAACIDLLGDRLTGPRLLRVLRLVATVLPRCRQLLLVLSTQPQRAVTPRAAGAGGYARHCPKRLCSIEPYRTMATFLQIWNRGRRLACLRA